MGGKSTQKGNQWEREAKTILEKAGWIVEGQHRQISFLGPGRMIMKGRDPFGVDLIAKKKGEKTRWIQVSSVGNLSKKKKQVLEFPWTLEYETLEIWGRLNGKKEFRTFIAENSGEGLPEFVEGPTQKAWSSEASAQDGV